MKKVKYFFIINLIFLVCCFVFISNAKIIYKDISSISIKTNFKFDYEEIGENGIDEINFDTVSSDNVSDDLNVYVYDNKNYYIESAEWYSDNTDGFSIGDEPKVVVYLQAGDYNGYSGDNDIFYRFLSSYNSSNCHISNGTFVSAQRLSYESLKVIFKINPIKGSYNAPTAAYFVDSSGNAVWEPDNILDSGYYELSLYRNDSLIKRIDKYHGRTYNFWQYMTKVGDYMFKVRTVPGTDKQIIAGKSSEYCESNVITLQENEINSTGQAGTFNNNTNTSNVGWVKQGDNWYFIMPTGSKLTSSWKSDNGKWYYLNKDGIMLTGLQRINNIDYFFYDDGSMLTGWLRSGSNYYFFNPISGSQEGAMCKNSWVLFQNKYFYFDSNGVMVTGWKELKDTQGLRGYYYFYPEGSTDGLFGYMATNTTINGFRIGSDGKWING